MEDEEALGAFVENGYLGFGGGGEGEGGEGEGLGG